MPAEPTWASVLSAKLISFGLQLLGALAVWIVGRWLINLCVRLIGNALGRQHVDPTILRYVSSIISVALNVILVVALLGYFGVETTSFAALLAAMGIAIGAAWSGLLANFAAGGFLIVLRPFKVGDFVSVGGITGTVEQVGLFATTINTPDNVQSVVGNNRIFSDTIQNYTNNPFRRVDRTALVAHGADVRDAVARLREGLSKIPNVVAEPAPDVEILDFSLQGTVLAVRPYCHNDHYWQVYFDTNRLISESFGMAGYPAPHSHVMIHQATG